MGLGHQDAVQHPSQDVGLLLGGVGAFELVDAMNQLQVNAADHRRLVQAGIGLRLHRDVEGSTAPRIVHDVDEYPAVDRIDQVKLLLVLDGPGQLRVVLGDTHLFERDHVQVFQQVYVLPGGLLHGIGKHLVEGAAKRVSLMLVGRIVGGEG